MLGFSLDQWIINAGYFGVLAIIFIETGLFVGFFLPGDSLLFAAGLLASQQVFKLSILIPAAIVMAILGYTLAYYFGEKLGHWLMQHKDTWWFKKRYLKEAHLFYEKHGASALILGRLVPVVRTFLPIAAGMAEMPWKRYMKWNIWGGIIWVSVVTLAGYFLGQRIPNAQHYILPISLSIIAISLMPAVWHLWKTKK